MNDSPCSVCGAVAVAGDAHLRFDGKSICADCKPTYFQRLREGVLPEHSFEPGYSPFQSFWIRVGKMTLYWLAIVMVPTPVVYATIFHKSWGDSMFMPLLLLTPILGMELIRWRMKLKWRNAILSLGLPNALIFTVCCILLFLATRTVQNYHIIQEQDRLAIILVYLFLLPLNIFFGMVWSVLMGVIVILKHGLK